MQVLGHSLASRIAVAPLGSVPVEPSASFSCTHSFTDRLKNFRISAAESLTEHLRS